MDFGNYEWSSGVKAPNPAWVVPVPLLELKADTGLWASHFPVSVQSSISEEHVQVKCHLKGDKNVSLTHPVRPIVSLLHQ